jgi:ribokinase
MPKDALSMGNVVVVGSLNADLTVRTHSFPEPGETVHGSKLVITAGGKGANQAVAASLLGAHVAMLGAVGDDAHGRMLRKSLTHARVDTARIYTVDEPTGTAIVVVDDRGENIIVLSTGANGTLDTEAVAPAADLLERAAVLCLCLEIPICTVVAAARAGRAAGVLVVVNLSPYADVPDELLENTDVLLVNENEASQLVGRAVRSDWLATLEALERRKIRRAVITLGRDGAIVLDATADDTVVEVATVDIDPIDTTGSGDAFTGALAARLAAGDTLHTAATFATRAGAFAATLPGTQASYPTMLQLDAWTP